MYLQPSHTPLVTCSFPNTRDRCQTVRLKNFQQTGKAEWGVCCKNVPNAALSTVVTIWWFNFSFLTSPSKCVLNRRQLYKRQLCCALINLFCKEKAPRKYSCRKRLESKSERLQGSEEAACWFIVCCSFIWRAILQKMPHYALLTSIHLGNLRHFSKQGPSFFVLENYL